MDYSPPAASLYWAIKAQSKIDISKALQEMNKIDILKALQEMHLDETYGEDGDTVLRLLLQTEDFAEGVVTVLSKTLYYSKPKNQMTIKNVIQLLTSKLECTMDKSDEKFNSIAHLLIDHERQTFFKYLTLDGDQSRKSDVEIAKIENDSTSFVEWLIQKGLDFDCVNKEDKAALHLSIEYNLQHISFVLLSHTKKVNRYIRQYNQSLLHSFLEMNAEYRDKYRGNTFKASRYSAYTYRYAAKCVKLLLKKGASAVAYNCWDRTPLYIAIREKEDMNIIDILVKDLLEKNALSTTTFVELTKSCAWWYEGRVEYYLDTLRKLVATGADVDAKDLNGTAPVYWAFRGQSRDAVAFLSDHEADFSVLTDSGENLFHALAKKVDPSVEVSDATQEALFDLLLKKGCCDINAKTKTAEETPLHLASESGNFVIVRKLVENDAEVDCKNASGETSLHLAVHSQVEKVVEFLLENGADVNSKDVCGRCPLFHAVDSERDRNPLVPLLLKWGTYVNAKIAGESSFFRAIRRFCVHNAREMLTYGADTNDDRVLSLLLSSDRKYKELQVLLMQHWVKLYAAKLPASKKHADIIKSKIQQQFYNECLNEVEKMKNSTMNDRISIYSFIHMDFGRRRFLINDEKLKIHMNSPELEKDFPKYAVVIRASYHESVMWNSLVEPAKKGWYKLTGIWLPGECLEPIFAHLRIVDLLGMIDGDL